MKLMFLKFAAKCRCCSKTVEAGHDAYFDKDGEPGKKVLCLACHAAPTPAAPTPAAPTIRNGREVFRDATNVASKQQAFSPAPDDEVSYSVDRSDFRLFDSVEEYRLLQPSAANRGTLEACFADDRRDANSSKWYGVTPGQIVGTLRDGWTEGAARLSELSEHVLSASSAESIRRQIVRGSEGDDLDIHRVYCGGLDTAWTKRKRASRTAPPTITLVSILGCAFSIEADRLFWRGAAMAKLSDILQEAGYNVEILAVLAAFGLCKSQDARSLVGHVIPVKRADMPLDICSVATTICLPGFWRYSCFKALANFDKRIQPCFCSFGNDALQMNIAKMAVRRSTGMESAIFAPPAIYTRKAADAWIAKAVEQITQPKDEQ